MVDLLQRVPRAAIAAVGDSAPVAVPAVVVWRGDRLLAGLAARASGIVPGQEVVVLIDEGVQWFELRAVYIRGRAVECAEPLDARQCAEWFEIEPAKSVAWDYGKLREVADGS